VIMPQMGESIAEGTLTKWLKKPGETVKPRRAAFRDLHDKVDAEIPAPSSGVLLEVLVEEGKAVPINTVVAVLGEGGEAAAAPAVPAPAAAAPAPVPQAAPAPQGAPAPLPPRPRRSRARRRRRFSAGAPRRSSGPSQGARPRPLRPRRHRHLGRVTKADILEAVAKGARGGPPRSPFRLPRRPPATRAGRRTGAGPRGAIVTFSGSAVLVEPMSQCAGRSPSGWSRQADLGARHVRLRDRPHEQFARLRDRVKDRFAAQYGTKLTYMPFVFRAAITALRRGLS